MTTPCPNPPPRWDFHNPHSMAGQKLVTVMRKFYHPLGFKKGYNFPLFLIGVGGLMGFAASRMSYWDVAGVFAKRAIPGEWYYYRTGAHNIGLRLHLIGAIAGGFLAGFQFVPIIRYKALLFHKTNGYVATILMLIGNAGAFMIMDVAIGGQPALQVFVGLLGAMITLGLVLAIYNIRQLQIDQHRAWMLRVWTWAACIASLRRIQSPAIYFVKAYGYVYHVSITCSEIHFMYQHIGVPDSSNPTGRLYPACNTIQTQAGISIGQQILSPADSSAIYVSVSSSGQGPENVAALFRNIFPMAAWLAIILHALAIEIYLRLTPAEHYRLRIVSYEKQVEKGYRVRGAFKDAGLTATRIGDAPDWWSVPADEYIKQQSLIMQQSLIKQKSLLDDEED